MTYRIQIEIAGAPELPNAIGRKHWRTKAKHSLDWRQAVVWAVGRNRPPKPLEYARVVIDVYRKRRPDPDNLVASTKPLLDSLQPSRSWKRGNKTYKSIGCGVLIDDKAENFVGGRAEVNFHSCGMLGYPRVIITVEEHKPPEVDDAA